MLAAVPQWTGNRWRLESPAISPVSSGSMYSLVSTKVQSSYRGVMYHRFADRCRWICQASLALEARGGGTTSLAPLHVCASFTVQR